ncbi:hypothetical protein NPIL_677181 [Nephila pilipes]|uniref:Uncharacterized protein n=1 Tax=Nephila pilipes TaxID=299642 RepID=A0A8X6UNI3_NEPPI|nr:hypothetical protein NPIL_677181 [Nephila pilipes]
MSSEKVFNANDSMCQESKFNQGYHLKIELEKGTLFEIVKVDLADPLHLADGSESNIVLLTCVIYRAVYLQSETPLSTETFIQSFRRFIERRGKHYVIYSDNWTNCYFKGYIGILFVLKLPPEEYYEVSIHLLHPGGMDGMEELCEWLNRS